MINKAKERMQHLSMFAVTLRIRLFSVYVRCVQLIRDIVHIFREHKLETRVLSASIRHPTHAFESAKAGAYAGTMPFKVSSECTHIIWEAHELVHCPPGCIRRVTA